MSKSKTIYLGLEKVANFYKVCYFQSVFIGLLFLLFSCKNTIGNQKLDTKSTFAKTNTTDSVFTKKEEITKPATTTVQPSPIRFGFGRLATEKEILAWDIDVRPDGKGLPTGAGNVVTGKAIYLAKCAACHGKTGTEIPAQRLVGLDSVRTKTIGNYWAYASTLYDYINRAMPFNAPNSLTANEVYSLTAYLLHTNKIIDSTLVLNAETLPKIVMPAQKRYVADDRKGGKEVK